MTSAQESIRKGSKSFFLASLFFPAKTKLDCWVLYKWCRHCDDEIDQAPASEVFNKLQTLRECTQKAFNPIAPFDLYREFAEVCEHYQIPSRYPADMLAGFAMDAQKFHFKTLAEVELYGYRVAGVVGLMMSHIMGVSEERALSHAVKLGIAMQLTNIARDIREDFTRDRVYLPAVWLHEKGIPSGELFKDPERLYALALRLLDRADVLYQEGRAGLQYLPLRAAWAVSIASYIYASIGRKIRKQGSKALYSRTIISFPEKIYWLARGTWEILPLVGSRLRRRFQPLPSPGEFNYEF